MTASYCQLSAVTNNYHIFIGYYSLPVDSGNHRGQVLEALRRCLTGGGAADGHLELSSLRTGICCLPVDLCVSALLDRDL